MSYRRLSKEEEEEIEYAEGFGEEFDKYSHVDLDAEHLEEESVLTEYDPDDFVSAAVVSPDSTLPIDLFEFKYSFGYDCHKYFNLCACDENVICWAAGSYITFFDTVTKQTWFQRTSTGGTVGNITAYRQDPNYRIAVAECREADNEPVIILYTWPDMAMDAVLREGTENAYSIMDFSPDGEMLVSIGREPDYNITVWNWKKHRITLRTSAFTYDVNTVMFSPYCPGQLTTAGLAHIKFWKMAVTFTGLKLKGDLGRFGKTEICDVLGVFPLPDEKVLSGCEWGNILVWEAGLVKVEVTRRARKVCHNGPIVQFMLSDNRDEVTTIAQDGWIRAWYWDTVDQADPPEDDPFVELNPVAETYVPDCRIMCLKHKKDFYWFAQDGNGGIWTVDLELDKIECQHQKLFTSHAGAVTALVAMRNHTILITGGEDGAVMAYNTNDQKLIARYIFPAAVSCMLYAPLELDETSQIVFVGFADGMMRTLLVKCEKLLELENMVEVKVTSLLSVHSSGPSHEDVIDMISWLKPHHKKLSQITINLQRTLLVTCGEDSTIFLYQLMSGKPFSLERLGYIETPNIVTYMTWKPDQERTLLLCGQVGLLMEAVLPEAEIRPYEEITTFRLEFHSKVEMVAKKQYLQRRPYPEEDDLASLDEEALKAAQEAEQDKGEEIPWIGEIQLIEDESTPSPTVIWAEYYQDAIWFVQEGTGALLMIKPGGKKIIKYAPLPGRWKDTLCVLRFICERQYLIIGTNNGYIRVVRMPTEEEDNPDVHLRKFIEDQQALRKTLKGRRLRKEDNQPIPCIEFIDHYYLAMHDWYRGRITCLEFSSDGRYMFTSGGDGNIFSYIINFEKPFFPKPEAPKEAEEIKISRVKEPTSEEGEIMSHEQLKQKEEYDKMMAIANAHKKRVRDQLAEIADTYNELIKKNKLLPVSQQIDVTLDPRPLKVQEEELEALKKLAIRKVAHQLEASDIGLWKMYSRNIIQLDVFPFTLKAIRDPTITLRPIRHKNLSQAFYDQLEEVHRKMAEAAARLNPLEILKMTEKEELKKQDSAVRRLQPKRPTWGPPRVASFLLGLPPHPPHPLKKALRNYYQRLQRHHLQFIEWQQHIHMRPDANALPPGAAEALKEAEATIGNYLLKTDPDYVAPAGHNTQLRLCLARQEIYEIKHAFNEKVLKLREHKLRLLETMQRIGERLQEIRAEIPASKAKPLPEIPTIDEDMEFPDRNLEVKPQPIVMPPKVAPHRPRTYIERQKSDTVYPVARVRQPRVPKFVPLSESRPLAASWEILKPRADSLPNPVETEIRKRRIERHLFEQDVLLSEADAQIQDFDARLRQLQRERIRVQEKAQLMELHLYQLHQEMTVLNRFESHEDELAEKVYQKHVQVLAIDEQIQDCEQRIDEHKAEKDQLALQCEEIQAEFKKLVQDNTFADFLRRIFKKKYRQPRDPDDDESSEESSSSSSEEEDEGSLDSRDIGPIRLDPNICPEGCEQEIYDKTYEMRTMRHKFEQEITEQDRLVELLKRDIDAHLKVKRKLTIQLDKRKQNLKMFMTEKQSCMNIIEQVVVLRYDQIRARALDGCMGPEGLSQTVVFPERLLTKLRNRVLELQEEIRLARARAKINRRHLFRMNIDLREMQRLIEEIKAQMRDVLSKKLGKPRKVDKTLDECLRQMARRHKYGLNLRILPHILTQFRAWRERHNELEQQYLKSLDNYSNRLRVAAALQADVVPQKPPKDPKVMYGAYDIGHYERDVVRLRIVREQQKQQIKELEDEIDRLRNKPQTEPLNKMPEPPPKRERSEIWLYTIPPPAMREKHRYFPITPVGSFHEIRFDMNILHLLNAACDAMYVSREDAKLLLSDLNDQLPFIVNGQKSRFEVVDGLVKKWLLKKGGDPTQYKKHTKAFDVLAVLAERLLHDHMEILEGAAEETEKELDQVEEALRQVSQETGAVEPLYRRIGPTIASLFHTAEVADLATEETMTSLVNSLLDPENPLTEAELDEINISDVMEEVIYLGVRATEAEIQRIVMLTVECLRAQLVSKEEAQAIEEAVKNAIIEAAHRSSLTPRVSHTSRSQFGERSHSSSQLKSTSRTISERASQPRVSIVTDDLSRRSSKEGDFSRRSSREGDLSTSSKEGDLSRRSSREGDLSKRSSKEGGDVMPQAVSDIDEALTDQEDEEDNINEVTQNKPSEE